MDNAANAERIAELRRIRSEQNLSIQQVYNLIEASGDPLSMTTVKKIFSCGDAKSAVSEKSLRQAEMVMHRLFDAGTVESAEENLIDVLREQNQFLKQIIVEQQDQLKLILDLCERGSAAWLKS